MKIMRTENNPVEVVDAVVCDMCGRETTPDDHVEYLERIRISGTGGDDSEIGDGTRWSLDICQHCFVERLGEFIRRQPDSMNEEVLI